MARVRKLIFILLLVVCAVTFCVPAYAANATITDSENNVSYKLTYDTVLYTYPMSDLKKIEISEISITARKGQSPSGSLLHIGNHAGTGSWTEPKYTRVYFSDGGADTDCTLDYSTRYSLNSYRTSSGGQKAYITLTRAKTSGHTWSDTWNMVSGSTTEHECECTHPVCVQKDTCTAKWVTCVNNGNGTHTFTCEEGHVVTVNCSGGTATCTEKATCAYCNTSYGEIDPDNHRPVSVPAVEPTQTKTGLTEGVVCGDCKTVLVPQRTLPILSDSDVPNTGASSYLVLWIILMASGVACIALMTRRRKQN